MAMRKDYHRALVDRNLTFDAIAGVIGQEMYEAPKSADRLNAAKTLLKSLGMDKYDTETTGGGGNWEDILIEASERKNALDGQVVIDERADIEDYEVDAPFIPESVKTIREEEREVGRGLYE